MPGQLAAVNGAVFFWSVHSDAVAVLTELTPIVQVPPPGKLPALTAPFISSGSLTGNGLTLKSRFAGIPLTTPLPLSLSALTGTFPGTRSVIGWPGAFIPGPALLPIEVLEDPEDTEKCLRCRGKDDGDPINELAWTDDALWMLAFVTVAARSLAPPTAGTPPDAVVPVPVPNKTPAAPAP